MHTTPPTNDEIAAALAAIALYLAPSPPAPATLVSPPSGWQAAIKLDHHALTTHKAPVHPSWSTIERLRRR